MTTSHWSKTQLSILETLDLCFWPNLVEAKQEESTPSQDGLRPIQNKAASYKSDSNTKSELFKKSIVKEFSNKPPLAEKQTINNKRQKPFEPKRIQSSSIELNLLENLPELKVVADKSVLSDDRCKVIDLSCSKCSALLTDLIQNQTKAKVLVITDPLLSGTQISTDETELFSNILKTINIKFEEALFLPITHDLAKGQGDPTYDELMLCRSYLIAAAELLMPQLIILSGQIATQSILKTNHHLGFVKEPIYRLNDQQPIIVFPDMVYLLEMPLEKKQVWQTIQRYLSNPV